MFLRQTMQSGQVSKKVKKEKQKRVKIDTKDDNFTYMETRPPLNGQ